MASPPLQYASFRWLLIGRVVSMIGNGVAPIALAFAVLDISDRASDLGLVVASRSVMNVLLLLYGGVLADRVPRRALMIASAVASGVTQGGVAALVLSGHGTVGTLAALSAVNGAVAGIGFPASSAMVPETVPSQHLAAANALLRIGSSSISIVAVSIGGVLVAAVGPGWGIAVDAGSFLFAAVAFSRIHATPAKERSGNSALTDLRLGWTEFMSRTWVWVIVLAFGVINAVEAGSTGVLGPVVADRTIHRAGYGIVLGTESVGLIIGSFIALKYQPKRALRFGTIAIGLLALPPLGLALSPTIPVLMACFFVCALSFDQFGVAWDTALQENVPADRLARVYSYDALGSFIAIPLGQLTVGPLASVIGVRTTLLVCTGIIVTAILAALSSSSVRNLERLGPTG